MSKTRTKHPWRMFMLAVALLFAPSHAFAAGSPPLKSTTTSSLTKVTPIDLSVIQPTTGQLYYSRVNAKEFYANISWSRNGIWGGIEIFPLSIYTARLTFFSHTGYTFDGVNVRDFRFDRATRITQGNAANELFVTFSATSSAKPYRIFTNLETMGSSIFPSTLTHRSKQSDIWLQNAVNSASNRNLISTYMGDYDDLLRPLVENFFYALPDVDGNGKVDVFITNLPRGVAGYVYYADQFTSPYIEGWNRPNFGETIYLDDEVLTSTNKSYFNRVLIHELQHVANRAWSETWLNEGLSEAAAHLYYNQIGIPGLQENIVSFNSASNRYSRDVTYWLGDALSYAKSYLFVQYVRTQIERIQGRGKINVYAELIQADRYKTSRQAVETVIQKYISPSLTFSAFVNDFNLALQRKDLIGKYGFNGETFFQNLR